MTEPENSSIRRSKVGEQRSLERILPQTEGGCGALVNPIVRLLLYPLIPAESGRIRSSHSSVVSSQMQKGPSKKSTYSLRNIFGRLLMLQQSVCYYIWYAFFHYYCIQGYSMLCHWRVFLPQPLVKPTLSASRISANTSKVREIRQYIKEIFLSL